MTTQPSTGAKSELAIVVATWTGLAVAIWPAGDFPLNDDWSYGRSVQILVDEGRFDLVYAAVPLVVQVAWGALFSLPLGFSFTALHASAWVLGLGGLIAFYALLRSLDPPPRVALFGTLLLAVNPFYLSLSHTFMTDVPFLAMSLAAIALLSRALDSNKRWLLVAAALLLGAALLIRQPAIAVAIGWGAAILTRRSFTPRALVVAAIPTIASLAVLFGYEVVVRRTVGVPPLYNNPYDPIGPILEVSLAAGLAELVHRWGVVVLAVGLFTMPVALVVAGPRWADASRRQRAWTAAALIGAATLATTYWSGNRLLPIGNVVYDVGVGPPLLRDVYLLELRHLPAASPVAWLGVAIAAVTGLVMLVLLGLAAWRASTGARWVRLADRPGVVVASVTGLVLACFLTITGFLDRYLLPLAPLATVPIVSLARTRPGRTWWVAGVAIAAVLGMFSVAGTHDYFAWNRARWQALQELTEGQGVAPSRIDGGLEFYGWVRYRTDDPEDPVLGWSRRTEEYVVAFGPIDGYSEIARYSYDRWLPPGDGQVVVLRMGQGAVMGVGGGAGG